MDRWATFDCYGTLIDWERGIGTTLSSLWPGADLTALLARYHQIEPTLQAGPRLSYREVMSRALTEVARAEEMELPFGSAGVLAESLPRWRAFPEVFSSLNELRERGWKLAILSNTDPDLLVASILQIGVEPDLAVTAREAGSYKPAPGHWLRFRELSGAQPGRHVHVAASPFHDLAPCSELGIPTVWVNRLGDTTDLPRAAELPDLSGLADILDDLVTP